jgi:aldose sugar dehydrogenase
MAMPALCSGAVMSVNQGVPETAPADNITAMNSITSSRGLLAGAALIVLLGFNGACAADAAEQRVQSEAVSFRVVEVVGGLAHPWSLAFLPDGSLLITERPGSLQRFGDGTLREIEGLPEISAQGQGGLMDVALHPGFETNRLIYLAYTAPYDGGIGTQVARARLDGDRLIDIKPLFRMNPPGSGGRHFGGRLTFDSDNRLYITIGDRGDQDQAQDLNSHHGALLRLNDDGSVPEDNPFVERDGARPEIYSYGHRNAQGLIYDAETGTLWQHEHGPFGGDVLHVIRPGANYGWPAATYGAQYGSRKAIGTTPDQRADIEDPVVHWTLPESIAPSGLTLYRGEAFPEWNGNLFVGALRHQQIRRLVLDGHTVVHEEPLLRGRFGRGRFGRIRDVRTGPDGYLWFTTDADPGGVYRIEPMAP